MVACLAMVCASLKEAPCLPAPRPAGHGGVIKVGDLGMSRYAAQWRAQPGDGSALERTLTPGAPGQASWLRSWSCTAASCLMGWA